MITKKQFAQEFSELAHEAGIRDTCAIDFPRYMRERNDADPRAFAEVDPWGLQFFFAPQVLELPCEHRRGLIMHELGHVLCRDFPDGGTEEDADRAAGEVFGVVIKYDCRWPGKGLQRVSNPDEGFHVAYLDRGKRSLMDHVFPTIGGAIQQLKALKRQGRTAWVEDLDGGFVPVVGAKRRPKFLKENPLRWSKKQVEYHESEGADEFVVMPAKDFLYLLSVDRFYDGREWWGTMEDFQEDAAELDAYNQGTTEGKIRVAPFLKINSEGRVVGHEGRHRAAALMNAEGEDAKMIVAIRYTGKKDDRPAFWKGEFVPTRRVYALGFQQVTADQMKKALELRDK